MPKGRNLLDRIRDFDVARLNANARFNRRNNRYQELLQQEREANEFARPYGPYMRWQSVKDAEQLRGEADRLYGALTDKQRHLERLRDNGIGGYVSIEDYAYANDIDPDELLEAMRRRMYNSGYDRNSRIWIDNYKNIVPTEQYRGRLMTPSVRDAIEQRKRELWKEYFEDEDPAPGIGWSEEKAEAMDKEFEEQARWDVLYPERRGWRY